MKRRISHAAALGIAVLALSATAASAARYISTATTSLALQSITSITNGDPADVGIGNSDLVLSKRATWTGNASGEAGTNSTFFEQTIRAVAVSEGMADFNGRVDTNAGHKAWFDFTNNSVDDNFALHFILSFNYVVFAMEPGPEYQHAEVTSSGKLLSRNDSLVREFSFTADSDKGPTSDTNTVQQNISFSIFSGESLRLSVVAESKGFAVAKVPLPGGAVLLGGALGMFGMLRAARTRPRIYI